MKESITVDSARDHRVGHPSPQSANINKSNTFLAWILLLFGFCVASTAGAQEAIVDDDEPPQATPGTLQFAQTDFTVAEGSGQVTITVTRTGGSDGEASVRYATSGGSASADSDYEPTSDTLNWTDGDAGDKTFTVGILDDSAVEPNKSFNLTLSNPTGASLGSQISATVTITDNDAPSVQVGFTQERFFASEESGMATVSVRLIGAETLGPSFQVRAIFSTSDGTAIAGQDYQSTQQVLTFTANQLTQDVTIPLTADNAAEGDETVNLSLSNPTGSIPGRPEPVPVNINPASATLVVLDDVPQGAELLIVSGENQGGPPGTVLDPFVVAVLPASGEPESGVQVTWSVAPESAGTLQGPEQTETDAAGQVRNTLLIQEVGVIRVTASVAGLAPVEFIVNGGLAGVPNLDEVAAPTARALDSACPAIRAIPLRDRTPGQRQLLNTCDQLITGQAGPLNAALRELAPIEVAAQGRLAVDISKTNFSNVTTRILSLTGETAGVSLSGLTLNYDGQAFSGAALNSLFGGGASADDPGALSKWGFFVNGSGSFGDSDETTKELGFDFNTYGITAGADYRFRPNFLLGGAFTYASQNSDFNDAAGGLDVNGYHFNIYGLYDNREIYYKDAFYVDAIASFGWNDYETSRRVSVGSTSEVAEGDTSGNEYAFSLGVRYKVDQTDHFAFGPYGRLAYIRANIDGYQERPADPSAPGTGTLLAIDDQTVDSLTTALGGEASYRFDTDYGVFSPHLRVDWTYEFLNGSRLITSRFLNDPTLTSFAIPTDSSDSNYFNLAIGTKAVFPRRVTGFFYYQTPLGLEGLSQHSFSAGIRVTFD